MTEIDKNHDDKENVDDIEAERQELVKELEERMKKGELK